MGACWCRQNLIAEGRGTCLSKLSVDILAVLGNMNTVDPNSTKKHLDGGEGWEALGK